MSSKEVFYKQGMSFSLDSYETVDLPNQNIKKVILDATDKPTATGGSTGTVQNNQTIEGVEIDINGKIVMRWRGGENIADAPSMAVKAYREFYKQTHKVYPANNLFVIEFPRTIPRSAKITLHWQTAKSLDSLLDSGHDRTGTSGGTYDVSYETGKAMGYKPMYLGYKDISHGSNTGDFFDFLNAIPYKLKTLMLLTHDNNTLANDTFDDIELGEADNPDFRGSFGQLRSAVEASTEVSLATGIHLKRYKGGKKIVADTYRIKTSASTGGTDKHILLYYACAA